MEFNPPVLLICELISERKFDIMGKTIKSRIKRFCAKYPEPRQYKIKLTWNRKDGYHEADGREYHPSFGVRRWYHSIR